MRWDELVEDDEGRVRGAGVNPPRLSIQGNRGLAARPPGFAEEEIDSGMSNDNVFLYCRRVKHRVSQFTSPFLKREYQIGRAAGRRI
jgi:hypothetical protein